MSVYVSNILIEHFKNNSNSNFQFSNTVEKIKGRCNTETNIKAYYQKVPQSDVISSCVKNQ